LEEKCESKSKCKAVLAPALALTLALLFYFTSIISRSSGHGPAKVFAYGFYFPLGCVFIRISKRCGGSRPIGVVNCFGANTDAVFFARKHSDA